MPLVVDVLVPLLLVFVGIFIWSQCVIPAVTGRRWFPVFRKRTVRETLLRELERAHEQQDDTALEVEIQKISPVVMPTVTEQNRKFRKLTGEQEYGDKPNTNKSA